MAMGNRNKWQPHNRFDHADDIVISQTYIDLYRLSQGDPLGKKDKKMIQASLDSIQKLSKMKGNEATKHGITWWWCDALFMAPPTLAKLSKDLKTPQYLLSFAKVGGAIKRASHHHHVISCLVASLPFILLSFWIESRLA